MKRGSASETGIRDPREAAALTEKGVTRGEPARMRPVLSALLASGIALLVAAYLARYAQVGLNPLDEGFALVTGMRVLHGQVPYRDFFAQISPASFYTQAALFKLFGVSVMPGRWAMVVVGMAIALLQYLLARRVIPPAYAVLSVCLWLPWGIPAWFMPNYSWYAALGTLLATYLLIRYREDGGEQWLWATGLVLGLTTLYKQNSGVYLLAALASFLALQSLIVCMGRTDPALSNERGRDSRLGQGRRSAQGQVAVLLLSAALVLIPALGTLAVAGALWDMWRDTVVVVLTEFPRQMGILYGPLRPGWPASLEAGELYSWAQRQLFILPVLVYPLSLLLVLGRIAAGRVGRQHDDLLLLTLLGGFSWLATFPRADIVHLLFFLAPAYVLSLYLVRTLAVTIAKEVRAIMGSRVALPVYGFFSAALVLLLLIPFLLLIAAGATHNESVRAASTYPVGDLSPRAAGIRVNEGQRAGITQVMEVIRARTEPEDPIFIIPWSIVFYFLADHPNPTRFDLLIPASLVSDDEPEVVQSLERSAVPLILYQTSWDVNGKTFAENAPLVAEYVTSHYERIGMLYGGDVYSEYEVWVPSEKGD